MTPPRLQLSLTASLVLVAGAAVVVWLFRLGVFWGIVGLMAGKHLIIAYLCQALGVDRRERAARLAQAESSSSSASR